ncbi:DUF2809 domain-containing protein [Paenibacillus sp. 1011MAR3C5]|uniref:ribosomal maturation YjgA family protein n=1 Tax=Paenibacillus sp. 1011MAR3C5 TaxID=1675787 RepID=UPI000E6B7F0B|nr:DUF2809 domain-containing protein [Paenibacillus sp. 1011MAR3C5]RJE88455.1 DUF2809 domain-containing protein [Paenibacillus sp. 1011MAR3C5]
MSLIKDRFIYAGATVLMLAAGLAARAWAAYLPDFVALHAGDALWAAMIYGGFRVLGAHKRLEWAVACSIGFCFAIEISQLYQADWILAVRETRLGGLVLGRGFLFVDLIRYVVGILLAYAADRWVRSRLARL